MHMGSQIQDAGDGEDVAIVADQRAGTKHRCGRCDRIFKYETSFKKHVESCQKEQKEEGVDFVKCEICGIKAKTLSKHITQVHCVSKEAYALQHADARITCDNSNVVFKARGQNFAWLKRAKECGDDLTEYKVKVGKAVSAAIMNNPEERARRAAQMAANNRTDAARELSRNTAKRTSARPEILKARSERLAKWREMNFDDFYEKCIMAMHSTWHSKPELTLFEILRNIKDYEFKHNQVIKSDTFNNVSKRKQVDIADASLRVYVEFDGIIHFEPRIKGALKLSEIQNSDKLLDEHIVRHGWTLIRISYDQFSYKEGGRFKESCLKLLFEHLRNPQPGVHCIGDAYGAKSQHERGT